MDPKTYALLPPSVLARWSRQSLKAFLSARTRPPTPAEVYEAITEYLKRFVYHDDPRALSLLVLFTMASYLHSLFEALPLLLITGERATGKTRLVELLSELGFNGQLRGSLTPAALARHVQRDQPLLCLDEAEDLGPSRRHQEIFRLLRAMYRRSGSREVCGAGGTSAVFNLFCPVILINIMGVDDALRDRIIEIQSTPRAGSVDRFRLHEQRDTLQGLRDKLYHFACAYVGEVYEDYHTCPQVAVISDRTEELWLPIFTLATVIDTTADAPGLFDEMVRFCRELHQKKAEQEQYAARDTKIIAGVYCFLSERGFLGSPSADINAAELTTCISVTESMPDLPIAEVSRVLDRAKIISKRFRRRVPGHATSPNPLIHYCIDVNRVIERAKTSGVLPVS
jgi:hypothetical protein